MVTACGLEELRSKFQWYVCLIFSPYVFLVTLESRGESYRRHRLAMPRKFCVNAYICNAKKLTRWRIYAKYFNYKRCNLRNEILTLICVNHIFSILPTLFSDPGRSSPPPQIYINIYVYVYIYIYWNLNTYVTPEYVGRKVTTSW